MVNPRKAYPVDPGLIALFERTGQTHHGRALETAVMLQLERDGWEVSYLRSRQDWEIDFFAHRSGDLPLLVQVCLDTEGEETWRREIRALRCAADAYPEAQAFLVTLDPTPPTRDLPDGVTWSSAVSWLLQQR